MFPFSGLLDLLCPPICPICGSVIENLTGKNEPLCSTCLQKIVTPVGQFCRRCGGRRFVAANIADECARCRTVEFRFKRVISLGEYENDLRLLILRMKTDPTGILATSAAQVLAAARHADLENVGADFILPIAMYRLRREDRGVNSPDILAEELGQQLNTPVAQHFVRRIRQTDLQYTLSSKARTENVAGAFALSQSGLRSLPSKTVLLVDDILTTGATCNEVAKVLLSACVRSVTVAVLARAEGDYQRSTT
jgi:ComF family protein